MTEPLQTLQPLLDLVGLRIETITALATYWIGLQFLVKLFLANWLKSKILSAIMVARSTVDTTDDEAILRLLKARWYKRLAFTSDVLFRIKLPLEADYTNTPVS